MDFNADQAMARSYYAATANRLDAAPILDQAVDTDVCVIGGGCTGLSAALHAAERGFSVVLLEGGRIGWGASGRNGGQIIPGLRKGAADLVRLFGRARARDLFALAVEGRTLMIDRVERHAISCDLRTTGHLVTAVKRTDLGWMKEEAECLATVMDYPHARVLSADDARAEVASPTVLGGLFDGWGGHVHPLNYTLGLADAARRAGVRIFENSAARRLDMTRGLVAETERGVVRARYGVLAGDALMGTLEPGLAARIMPVANYVVATEPLDDAAALIPNDIAICDSRFVVNYFRLTADRRLLFGGGERYTPAAPADIASFVRPYMLGVFPQLADRRIDHAWGGMVSVTTTRLPHIGRIGDVFFAHGYSGQGVALTTLAGSLLAEAMVGTAERFDVFATVAPPAFPGGVRMRYPLHVLGMVWYALRDRL